MEQLTHISVLREESIEALNIRPDGTYVDATLGGGGHSREILKKLNTGRLYAIDRDDYAINRAKTGLKEFEDRLTLIKSDFRYIKERLEEIDAPAPDGILFDLGVSSFQLDDADRGFSYMHDAHLDMRMDREGSRSAWDVVNTTPVRELAKIIFEYGEERYGNQIANAIDKARSVKPIDTTFELTEIIKSAMPAQAKREKQHPAKRTFQAIRIEVNDELSAVAEAIEKAADILAPGGRIAVITFHSLEDRIVKKAFAQMAKGCICPSDFPQCVCGIKPKLRLVNSKPYIPSDDEIEMNPRSRSAKLRVAERL